jgi:pimeloyl-ACP methyl ester carboxylesterase
MRTGPDAGRARTEGAVGARAAAGRARRWACVAGGTRAATRAVLVAAVLVTGASQAETQMIDGPPPLPPPGRLVDVGGWRLHLYCVGERRPGSPAVILEAGLGDFSVEWALVQPHVAPFARVCSYDRAGDGWSDLGPHPRTMRQIVYELHTALDRAGEPAPFVLVGHSYGGVLARVYQRTYPDDVAALVLVEPGLDDPARLTPAGLVRSSDLATGRPIPPPRTHGPLRTDDIAPAALARMRAGLAEASRNANAHPRDRLPPEAQRMRSWALGRVEHVAAAVNPFEHEELAALRSDHLREQPLGDLPLFVLTRGLPDGDGPDAGALEDEHRQAHARLSALTLRGALRIATRSGHHVSLDDPATVVTVIRDVLALVR